MAVTRRSTAYRPVDTHRARFLERDLATVPGQQKLGLGREQRLLRGAGIGSGSTWATQLLPAARGVVTSLFASSVFTGAAAGLESHHAFGTLFTIAAVLAGVVAVAGTAARLRSHRATA